ncbi:MAG: peptidoglycan recognition family protein, partial [Balneolaceae bacterium]|nr:peptidoglycan recognition family protein [Balneolaceae bacterium]
KERNKVRKEFWLQVLGTLLAIGACYYSEFSIWVFITLIAENAGSLQEITPAPWEYAFTGVIIGSGSKPINFLMNFLLNRRIETVRDEVKAEAATLPDGAPKATEAAGEATEARPSELPPATLELQPPSIEELAGFEYDGGDRPNRLEHTHLYRKPVDLIVYHHTAMHSDAPFEEVVKVFDRRGWLTGYHCIVFKDGTIRVLCRWDRFGNHAKPFNAHSMGIALQGNFEPDPSVPYSNPDGRYGILAPSHEQLQAAARIVALCAHLHGMEPAFPSASSVDAEKRETVRDILPHNMVARKACPGGNFPHDTFRESVNSYHAGWKSDQGFAAALKAFKNRPKVMPEYS